MTGFFSPWFSVLAMLAMAMWIAIRLLFFWLVATRFSYWLAIVQQKEYRWDRLKMYLKTKEGWRALLVGRLWLILRPSKMKRPKITVRILLITFLSIGLWFPVWQTGLYLLSSNSLKILDQVQNDRGFHVAGWLLVCWWLVPFFIGLATLPSWLISELVTRRRLKKAKRLIDKNQPIIIGITGSYGKTSTRHLLSHLLGDLTQVWTPADSHNTRLSIATDINNNYQGQSVVLLEYSAYTQSEIANLTKYFPPQIAIITGLTYQHGGLFGSLEKIIQAKSELIAALPAKSVVYWNGGCPDVEKIVVAGLQTHRQLHKDSQIKVMRVDPRLVEISDISISSKGCLQFQFAQQKISMSIVGKHYVQNIALATAVARDQGVSTSLIIAKLLSFQPNRYFTRIWQSQSGVVVIDDGGSTNPAGFASVVELAKQIEGSPKILITSGIVDLGDKSSKIHKELASQAKSIIDQVFYVGETGREGFKEIFGLRVMLDQKSIVENIKSLKPGTLLIIEGRLPGWITDFIPKDSGLPSS